LSGIVIDRWHGHYNRPNGFSFIKPDDGSKDVFCHASAIRDGSFLRQGDKVEFTKVWDEHHKKDRAEDVTGGRFYEENPPRRDSRSEVCRDFQAGRCTRGSSCRFSHSDRGHDSYRGHSYCNRDSRNSRDDRRDRGRDRDSRHSRDSRSSRDYRRSRSRDRSRDRY
jgi:cold shock CspA family protein